MIKYIYGGGRMEESIIKISNLTFAELFNNFNINFKENKLNFISGPNNCGKTTLIRILNNQYPIVDSITVKNKLLEEYTIEEYSKLVKCIIPEEIIFSCETLDEEVTYINNSLNQTEYKELLKDLKLKKIKTEQINDLTEQEKIKVQLLLGIISNAEIILIDNIGTYFTQKEMIEIIKVLKNYQEKKSLTIIFTTSDLEDTLNGDYLFIISESNIVLEGAPIDVLQKDNVINKVGLNVPFMVDLSVKLRDYELINEIELDMDRMVEKLWK